MDWFVILQLRREVTVLLLAMYYMAVSSGMLRLVQAVVMDVFGEYRFD